MRALVMILSFLLFSPLASAQTPTVEDVDTLIKERKQWDKKTVSVKGQVKKVFLEENAILLESGGWLKDEIVVLAPAGLDLRGLAPQTQLTVLGRVETAQYHEIKEKTGRFLAPEIEERIEDANAFMVAEDVTRVAE